MQFLMHEGQNFEYTFQKAIEISVEISLNREPFKKHFC